MDWAQILNVVASAFSLVLAVVAIWQAIVYYRLSVESQRGVDNSMRKIEISVTKIEDTYSRLYGDLFSMTQETVRDMRKHVFNAGVASEPLNPGDQIAGERTRELASEVSSEVSTILEKLGVTEDHIVGMQASLNELVERAVDGGREVEREVRGTELRQYLLENIKELKARTGTAVADELIMTSSDRFAPLEARAELEKLRSEGLVEWNSPQLEPGSIVHIVER
jgi:hypothetical protein